MQSKWYKYILASTMVLCSPYAASMSKNAFAQERGQTEEMSGSDRDYLQWQLKQMEESMQKQQEQIQALKNRMEAVSPTPAPVTKEEIKHEIEDYLSTDEARKKMALGMAGLTPVYTPDDEKYALSIRSADGNYTLNTGARMQFRYTFKDRDEDAKGEDDLNDINLRRARVYFGGNIYSKIVHYY
ncbi:MAG: porin, partial [Candidatus Brocadiaceae bacterium]